MSIDQYKDKNRTELWEIVQIQAQVTTEMQGQIAELENQLAEGEALIIELVEALKGQHKPIN